MLTYKHRYHNIFIRSASAIFFLLILSVTSIASSSDSVSLRVPIEELPKVTNDQILDRTDYGSFSIIEVTPSVVQTLKASGVRFFEEKDADFIGIQGHAFNSRKPITVASVDLQSKEIFGKPMLYIVQLKGPTKEEWLADIKQSGGQIISYIPQNSYLVWIDPSKIATLKKGSGVRWVGSYHPAYKIAADLNGATGQIDYLSVVIYNDPSNSTIRSIEDMGGRLVNKWSSPFSQEVPGTTALFSADASLIKKIAQLERVIRIDQTTTQPGTDDEVACKIIANHRLNGIPYANPSYRSWLDQIGFDGTGSVVAIVDTGCDKNPDPKLSQETDHPDLHGRLEAVIKYTSNTVDVDGHGTHIAGIIAGTGALGTVDDEGYLYGQGVAPGSKLLIQQAIPDQLPPSGGWERLTIDTISNSAFVSNNSWYLGNRYGIGYSALCRLFDIYTRDGDSSTSGNQPIVFVFSSGNSGPGMSTVFDPKEAKNIITVGASENYRPDRPFVTNCGGSTNIDGVASFSSRGPCIDGRILPTLVAPGTNIASTASYYAPQNKYNDPSNPCKRLLDSNYAWMSGTSQAAPMVSGAIALIAQWWRSVNNNVNPSPAMCKAILVNSADDLGGGPDGRGGQLAHIPNSDQGWGRLNIAAAMDTENCFFEDQKYIFTSSGQSRSYRVRIIDPTKPLKVTLVWTDAPGTPGAYAWANDLDLSVTGTYGTYVGNNFQNGWSIIAPGRDSKNNVECVYLPNPYGVYTVTVTAANIVADAIPGNGASADQDYALVIRNGVVGGDPLLPYTPVVRSNTALPDYYMSTTEAGGWYGFAVKADDLGDHDLTLYADPGYSKIACKSAIRGSGIDIIAVNGNYVPPGLIYPKVSAYVDQGGYRIEYATKSCDLIPGVTDHRSFSSSSMLRMWDIEVTERKTCALRVQPSSSLDVGISIFGSRSDSSYTWYRAKEDRLFEANSKGMGQAETLYFQIFEPGRYGVAVWNNKGYGDYSIIFDDSVPTTPNVYSAGYSPRSNSISVTWSESSDPETGISKYEYAIGLLPGSSNIVNWTDVGLNTSVVCEGLFLNSGQNYYVSVRATNGIGLVGGIGSTPIVPAPDTDIQLVDIAAAKELPDGSKIMITSKPISAVFNGRFYISEPERFSGIGVNWSQTVPEGAIVDVIGTLATRDGERFIDATEVKIK